MIKYCYAGPVSLMDRKYGYSARDRPINNSMLILRQGISFYTENIMNAFLIKLRFR